MEWHDMLFFVFFTLLLLHLFRVFICSGPPARKTVIQGLVTTFTYCIQLHMDIMYGLTVIGWFPESTEEFIRSHPQGEM